MPESNAADRLCDRLLASAENDPLKLRAQIYRDCADILAPPARVAELRKLAERLDAIEADHQQLVFDFKRQRKS